MGERYGTLRFIIRNGAIFGYLDIFGSQNVVRGIIFPEIVSIGMLLREGFRKIILLF